MDVTLIMTCYAPYLRWVEGAMESIDAQAPPFAQRMVAFDRCDPPAPRPGWTYVTGAFGNPSEAQNAAMLLATSPWVVFWDSDNVMAPGYLAAMVEHIARADDDVAMIYPDLEFVDEELRPLYSSIQPEWEYWASRMDNPVDTASAWRRSALELSGGWMTETILEDFSMALRLTAAGWRGMKLQGPPVIMRQHGGGIMSTLRRETRLARALWETYSLAMVTVFGGDGEALQRWLALMTEAELPRRTAFYAVDASGSVPFRRSLVRGCEELAARRPASRLDISAVPPPLFPPRHDARSAYGHAAVLGRIPEDTVLTFAEDVLAHAGTFRILGEEMCADPARHAAVAAACPSRTDPAVTEAERLPGKPLPWDGLPHEPIDVASAGGGCTLWASWALRRFPVHVEPPLDWPAVYCREVRRRGFTVRLHGGARCGRAGITKDYPCPSSSPAT